MTEIVVNPIDCVQSGTLKPSALSQWMSPKRPRLLLSRPEPNEAHPDFERSTRQGLQSSLREAPTGIPSRSPHMSRPLNRPYHHLTKPTMCTAGHECLRGTLDGVFITARIPAEAKVRRRKTRRRLERRGGQ